MGIKTNNLIKKISNDQLWYDRMHTVTFLFQRLRVWSRAAVVLYLFLLHHVTMWAIGLPDISNNQAVIISVITTLATPIFGFYTKSGRSFYEYYGNLKYSNYVTKYLDRIGFILDKLRIFPLAMMIYYCFLLYVVIMWGISLGDGLSGAQAAFISTFSGSATMVFGFFVTSGEVNMDIEKIFIERHNIDNNNIDSISNIKYNPEEDNKRNERDT